jgi:hypothetical protein
MGETPAHEQRFTHTYSVHYPAHLPREDDPHYVDFAHYRQQTEATAKCTFGEARGDFSDCKPGPDQWPHGLELHHAHIEFALQNAVDLALLETVYPGISNPDEVGAWVESANNLVWLCMLPDVPVRMADGSEKAISDVHVGDLVRTHDGSVQPVLAAVRKPYRGEVFRIGSATLTPTHRVLTHRGWLPAAEVVRQFRMHGPDVIFLRCEEEQVLRGIVRPVPVDMVDTLTSGEWAPDNSFHHPAVLKNLAFRTVIPDEHSHVPCARDMSLSHRDAGSLLSVQRNEAARVRAVVNGLDVVAPHCDQGSALATLDRYPRSRISPALSARSATGATTGHVTRRYGLGSQKGLPADFTSAFSQGSAGFYGGWYALREVRSLSYTGYVHDITVANSHSFIAGGMVVHNCMFHHRGHGGVHVATSSDYEAERFIKGLIS